VNLKERGGGGVATIIDMRHGIQRYSTHHSLKLRRIF
jgi:hypothetical protein